MGWTLLWSNLRWNICCPYKAILLIALHSIVVIRLLEVHLLIWVCYHCCIHLTKMRFFKIFKFLFILNRTDKTFLRIKSQRRRHQHLSERNLEYDITEKNEYLDMGIFMAFFIVVSLVCLIMIIKVRLLISWKMDFSSIEFCWY